MTIFRIDSDRPPGRVHHDHHRVVAALVRPGDLVGQVALRDRVDVVLELDREDARRCRLRGAAATSATTARTAETARSPRRKAAFTAVRILSRTPRAALRAWAHWREPDESARPRSPARARRPGASRGPRTGRRSWRRTCRSASRARPRPRRRRRLRPGRRSTGRAPARVLFRTHAVAGRWSAWRPAAPEAEDLPDPGSRETRIRSGLAARQPLLGRRRPTAWRTAWWATCAGCAPGTCGARSSGRRSGRRP